MSIRLRRRLVATAFFAPLLVSSLVSSLAPPLAAMELEAVSKEYESLVPRQLLGLLHAAEVQRELGLSKAQVASLEALFAEIDGPWFRSRILPADKQLEIVGALEQKAHAWLASHGSGAQRERLRQLELRAQAARILLRDDVAQLLAFDARQQKAFAERAQETLAAQAALHQATMKGESTESLQQRVAKALQAEKEAAQHLLTAEQRQRLGRALGQAFDTSQLKRIFPMAPEFVAAPDWINSPPLKLQQLRGKVVLIHFYAFQCHNCHANFDIYKRWHDELRDKGVVVIGIQTPETARERDLNAVKQAAVERDLKFPILVDLKSENWKAWGNTMWPTVYVVDKNGYLRHLWQGELNWKGATGDKTIEQAVELALAEPDGI